MKKSLAILIALSLATVLVPAAEASETVTRQFVGSVGASVAGTGPAFIFCYAPGVCNFDEILGDDEVNEGDEIPFPIGGADLIAAGLYSNTVIGGVDDMWANDIAMAPCFYHPDGDETCAVDGLDGVSDYPGERACGGQALTGAPFISNFVSVFVFTIMVTEELQVCGATQGSLSATFF